MSGVLRPENTEGVNFFGKPDALERDVTGRTDKVKEAEKGLFFFCVQIFLLPIRLLVMFVRLFQICVALMICFRYVPARPTLFFFFFFCFLNTFTFRLFVVLVFFWGLALEFRCSL